MDNRPSGMHIAVDTHMLSGLLIDLNIARRNARSYPKGHPIILASLQKVLSSYTLLMQSNSEIAIGVARDMLMVEGTSFDKNNPVFRDFARVLFELGIATLVLRPGVSLEELRNFILLLGLKREEVHKHGGIENLWLKARIATLSVRPVRYDLFTATDENTIVAEARPDREGTLWERFARHVQNSAGGEESEESFDPELVAAILNGQQDHRLRADSSADVDMLADLARHLGSAHAGDPADESSMGKLGTLVSRLNPELRRQFLNSSFSGSNQSQAAQALVANLSTDTVLEILEDVNAKRTSMPPVIMGMLQRLAEQGDQHRPSVGEGGIGAHDPDVEKIRTLFSEHVTEDFTPDEYQQKLNRIMATATLPRLQDETVDELMETLQPHFVESRISEIILQVVMAEPGDDGVNSLAAYMGDLCGYFLETGEYEKLLDVMRQSSETGMPPAFGQALGRLFSSRAFMQEILNGLKIWGKPRFEQIRGIILHIGEPFIAVLLDQLKEESSMSLRRFIMDRVVEFGPLARDAVIRRLSDNKWYFLRNLLIILRSMNDPSILDHLRPLTGHDNPHVRHEVFKILLHYQDSSAEEQLLRDLDNPAPGGQLAVVPLAAACASPAVLKKLVAMLNRTGFSAGDCELKSAVVKALGEIGKAEVLPELAKVLGSSSMLHSKQLARLKEELVHSLEYYPHQIVVPILQRLASGKDEVARQAAVTLQKIKGRQL